MHCQRSRGSWWQQERLHCSSSHAEHDLARGFLWDLLSVPGHVLEACELLLTFDALHDVPDA